MRSPALRRGIFAFAGYVCHVFNKETDIDLEA